MQNDNIVYDVDAKLPFGKNLLFAFQQVLSIIVATMLVPLIADASGVYLSQSAALVGAGVGTIVYLCLTKFKSPVCLGSSFAFIAPLTTAISFGYFGILLGAIFSGLVYVVLAVIIHFVGTNWISRIMPPIVIGPVVALIGFELASSAINNIMNTSQSVDNYNLLSIAIGIFTFFVVIIVSTKGGKNLKMFPFIVGIGVGYIVCSIFTLIGIWTGAEALKIIDFSIFNKVTDFKNWLPNITFIGLFSEGAAKITSFGNVVTLFMAYVPIAVVSFAEHIADHKNLSSIIGKDLIKDPGLTRTLLGDGLGSISGAMFGGCPNTTYGESIGCVAISKNASTRTILTACIICILLAFFYPVVLFVETIPTCVVGGICIALYGFISVSGLRMLRDVDLNESKNLFVVASIFICGIGGLVLHISSIEVPSIACALIVGILANFVLRSKTKTPKISQNSEFLESKETIPKDDNPNTEQQKEE